MNHTQLNINKNSYKIYNSFIITHTLNDAGARNMKKLISGSIYARVVYKIDFIV